MISGKPEFSFNPYGNGKIKIKVGFVAQVGKYRAFIPSGTITNGATIPRVFWLFFSPYDKEYFLAATVHDALVGEFNDPIKVFDVVTGKGKYLDWKESAKFFRGLMGELNAPKWKRNLFYHAVMIPRRLRLKK